MASQEGLGRILLRVTVELGQDSNGTILVREGDDIDQLAADFCAEYQLEDKLIEPLAAHVRKNLTAVEEAQQRGLSSSSRPARTPRPADPEVRRSAPKRLPPPPPDTGSLATPRTAGLPQRHCAAFTPAGRADSSGAPSESSVTASLSRRGFGSGTSRNLDASWSPPGAAPPLPRTPGEASVRRSSSQDRTPGPKRYELLHQDAFHRKNRLERLRQEVDKLAEGQVSAAFRVSPGSLRCATWHRSPEESGVLGERLYRDAAQRQLKLQLLQALRQEQRRRDEEIGATFKPAIEVSQRACQGIARSLKDPEGQRTKTKIERLREMRERSALEGCTFKPEIDPRSEMMVLQRISRMGITGTLYDALYEDAIRRKERQLDAEKAMPAGATFQPDIGAEHYRPPNDDTREDFVNRLAYSKSFSDRWLNVRKQHLQNETLQDSFEFRPQTGRGPTADRNKNGLPIGSFLYEFGRERAAQVQAMLEEEERANSHPSTPRISESSRQLFEDSKRRKYLRLFSALVSRDSEGRLRALTLTLDELEPGLVEFLRPLVQYLEDTSAAIDFSAFTAALDYQRKVAVTPTAHLFVEKGRPKTPTKQEWEEANFLPRAGKRSSKLAARVRARSLPLYERLHGDGLARESRLMERRLVAEEKQLEGCTFRPVLTPRSRAPRPKRARSQECLRDDEHLWSFAAEQPPRGEGDSESQVHAQWL